MDKTSNASTIVSLRLTPDERRLIEEAAAKKGWKTAHFLRVSAIERAAHVLNLSRPTTFDFSAAAKRYAEVLLAPRKVNVLDEAGDSLGRLGEGAIDHAHVETRLCDVRLVDFSPAPLRPDEVDKLQEAMRLGGPEFAAELIVECRRVVNKADDPSLPPPIDPHNLNDLDKETA